MPGCGPRSSMRRRRSSIPGVRAGAPRARPVRAGAAGAVGLRRREYCQGPPPEGARLRRRTSTPKTVAELRARVAKARTTSPVGLRGRRRAPRRAGVDAGKSVGGDAYLTRIATPNFYFHVTMSYAILRHNGVSFGKADFIRRQGWGRDRRLVGGPGRRGGAARCATLPHRAASGGS